MPDLPLEIHGRIAAFVSSPHSLVKYLLTSKWIFPEVERQLYRSIHIQTSRLSIVSGLLRGFLDNPSRSPSTIELSITISSHLILSPDDTYRLASALATMTNLIALHLAVNELEISSLKHENFPFKLQKFSFSADPYEQLDCIPLKDLLVSQPSIRHLDVAIFTFPDPLPPDTIPNLETLRGPASLGQALLPGRPVERLHWAAPGYASYFISERPYLSLQVLKLDTTPKEFQLARMCPNLLYLEFQVYHSVSQKRLLEFHLLNTNRVRWT